MTKAMLPVLPALRATASPERLAQVVNIGSIGILHTAAVDHYAYSPSKAAVHHPTRSLLRRLAGEMPSRSAGSVARMMPAANDD